MPEHDDVGDESPCEFSEYKTLDLKFSIGKRERGPRDQSKEVSLRSTKLHLWGLRDSHHS